MLINALACPITLGRFRILPGEKLPTTVLTDAESEDLKRYTARGAIREEGAPASTPAAKPTTAPEEVKAVPQEEVSVEAESVSAPKQQKGPKGHRKNESME